MCWHIHMHQTGQNSNLAMGVVTNLCDITKGQFPKGQKYKTHLSPVSEFVKVALWLVLAFSTICIHVFSETVLSRLNK